VFTFQARELKKMSKPLVSIVTPCFNGELVIHRLLDSILNQTYPKIELIIVDDGSSDRTKEVVLSYSRRFSDTKIKLIYIYQENAGQAEAINTGLKEISGDYLCWPDSDDYLEPESIEKRVRILEKCPEYGVVTSDAFIRDIKDLTVVTRLAAAKQAGRYDNKQFEFLLSGASMFLPGTHMIRVSCFKKTHPDGRIVGTRGGQNWQILLPLYYYYDRYFLDEPLYNYVVYRSSHSQGDDTEEKQLYRCDEHEEIITETLNSMDMDPNIRKKCIFETRIRYVRKRLTIAFFSNNQDLVHELYEILIKEKQSRCKEFIYALVIRNKYTYRLFNFMYVNKFIISK
jgi:glycosyltransferase involved in cell wall biosynthesis